MKITTSIVAVCLLVAAGATGRSERAPTGAAASETPGLAQSNHTVLQNYPVSRYDYTALKMPL